MKYSIPDKLAIAAVLISSALFILEAIPSLNGVLVTLLSNMVV